MTKRSQRHALKSQSGCMWNLLSLFDFRGRSTAKFLMDRKRESRHGIGGHLSGQRVPSGGAETRENSEDDNEDMMPMDYAARRASSVKELMAAEMITEQFTINQSNDSEVKSEKRIKNKRRKRNRSRAKSGDMDVTPGLEGSECSPVNQVPEPKLLNNLDLEAAMEELARISLKNTNGSDHDFEGTRDATYSHDSMDVQKLVSALKQVMISNGNGFHSDEFSDALQMLTINKGMFLKLLQDQNSTLVADFQKLVDASGNESQNANSDMLEEKQSTAKLDEFGSRNKHWNFFRRSKSVENYYPLEWDDKDYLSPGRIVVLKPNLARSPHRSLSVRSHHTDNKNVPFFSFTNFKRKLRNAMGKERQPISPGSSNLKKNQSSRSFENFGWSSPNRNHFYTERFAIFSSTNKPKDKNTGASGLSRIGGSDIYTEAKKHLSDVLKNGDENTMLKDGHFSKSLGRILSFPDYSGLSPGRSPRKYSDIVITPEMRFSPLGKNSTNRILQEKISNCSSPRKHNLESQSGGNSPDKAQCPENNGNTVLKDDRKGSSEVQSSNEGSKPLEVFEIEEVVESRNWEEEKIVDISSKGDFRVVDYEESASPFLQDSSALKSDLYGDVRISSPSAREIDDSYHVISKTDRPSPISVLDSLFTDDNISPASTVSPPVEKEIQPRQIHFEDESSSTEVGVCTRISSEDEESAFEYVEAVLLGSGLNWDDFLTSWLSSYNILDSSLFNEVELFSSRPHHDQKLLFDCANEGLKEVCEAYFNVSGNRPNIRPIPKGMDLINETWKRVERFMVLHPASSLDELIKMDMESSRSWMELQPEVEVVGFAIGEAVVDELVEDFVVSLVDDTSMGEVF